MTLKTRSGDVPRFDPSRGRDPAWRPGQPWLHGVAHRVAVRARAQAARRHVHETAGLKLEEISSLAPGEQTRHELRLSLDDELARLPASLRSPVILCYLEGLTHDEAARRLRWPVGTVRSRLARARDVLRKRLASQGIMTDGRLSPPRSPGSRCLWN